MVDDGSKYGSADATDVFVFFDSNQAKSATQNNGGYSRDSNDLRFSTQRDRTNIDTATRRMSKFVDAYTAGQVKGEDTQLLGPTPVVLRAIGAQEFDLEIDGAVLQKTLNGKHSYAVTPGILKQLPEGLYDPLMVFAQPDGGALVVTEMESDDGNPIVAAVHFRVRSGRLLVNRIATAHEFEDYAPRLEKQAKQLRYIRNEEGLAASTKLGQLDLPNLVQKARDLGSNISRGIWSSCMGRSSAPPASSKAKPASPSLSKSRRRMGSASVTG